jgi:hypothetical protein
MIAEAPVTHQTIAQEQGGLLGQRYSAFSVGHLIA